MFSVFIKTNRTELEGRWEFFKYGIVAIFGSQPMFLAVHTTGSELTVVACSGFYGRFSSSNRTKQYGAVLSHVLAYMGNCVS